MKLASILGAFVCYVIGTPHPVFLCLRHEGELFPPVSGFYVFATAKP